MQKRDIVRDSLELVSDCALLQSAMRIVMRMADPAYFSIVYEARNRIVDEFRFLVTKREQLLGDSRDESTDESMSWSVDDEQEASYGDLVLDAGEQIVAAFESIGDKTALFDLHPAWHGKPATDCIPELAQSPDYASIMLSVSKRAATLRAELRRIQGLLVPQCAREIARASTGLDLEIRDLQDQVKLALGWPVSRGARAIAIRNSRASKYFQASKLGLDESLMLMDRLLECFCACSDESTDMNALALIVRSFIEPTSYGAEINLEG